MNDSPPIFSTRDLYLASVLVTLKFYLLSVDYQIEGERNNAIGYFNFEDTPSLQEAKNKYSQGLLSVEPKMFMTNVRSLKAEVTNITKAPHMSRTATERVK